MGIVRSIFKDIDSDLKRSENKTFLQPQTPLEKIL